MLFLLCCLFPEDYNNSVEELAWYCMGLRMLDEIRSIEEARKRTHTLVEKLKSRFLLLDGLDFLEEHHVKMHDVVRDVAVFIGSKEKESLEVTSMDSLGQNSSHNCKWLSVSISNERMDLALGFHFPNLRLLMMKSISYKMLDISFQGMEDLNVLSFSEIEFPSLPRTLGLLINLRTLHLYNCTVGNISVIGELASLEILCCYYCDDIVELPEEFQRLNHLRLLELYRCYELKTIAFGIISSLVRLEELRMFKSFCNWESEEKGKVRRNAALTEIQSLPNLTCLEIEIDDWNLAAQEICLSQKLVKYYIHIYDNEKRYEHIRVHSKKILHDNGRVHHSFDRYAETHYRVKVMILELPRHITIGKWIRLQVRNTEFLVLKGDGLNNINIAEIENLRVLEARNCSTMKKLVNSIDCKSGTVFPFLESLVLSGLEKLEEVCDGTIPEGSSNLCKSPNQKVSLCNLTSIYIFKCSNLRSLFSVSIARSLLQLEKLLIEECGTMEEIFWNENKSITFASIEFPKLKDVTLRNLPKLTALCQGVESIHFAKLTEMRIGILPKLNSLCPLNSEPAHDDTSFHFLCNQKVKIACLKRLMLNGFKDNVGNIWCHHIPINFFRNLKNLSIVWVNGIRSLMSYSIAKNLVSLEYLYISSCQDMVEVIEDEEEIVDMSLFPTMRELELYRLPKLTSFCQWKHAFKLPSLENVEIDNCPVIETLTLGLVSTPAIKKCTINNRKIDDTKDLNDAIHHFRTKSGERGRGSSKRNNKKEEEEE